ncbi:hypothetical protein B0O99DRAFT_356299 [Bisporella sp. PMI_857]|nr:hypothetical protein B0O99DRAFT_356299 [Bisporella sp. PMI_857]
MPEMEGRMEPHVLARFRRIHFYATFSYLHTENIKLQVLDELDACTVHPHHAAEYKKILRASPIMKNFVRVLSNSPYIMSLRISLLVQIMPTSDFMTDNEFDDVFLGKVNQRATELFLDSGICDSLPALSNVQKFDFELDLGSEREPYIPLQHHVTQIQEMKSIIESKFKHQEIQLIS